jgi:hypothetical protein
MNASVCLPTLFACAVLAVVPDAPDPQAESGATVRARAAPIDLRCTLVEGIPFDVTVHLASGVIRFHGGPQIPIGHVRTRPGLLEVDGRSATYQVEARIGARTALTFGEFGAQPQTVPCARADAPAAATRRET